jgi:nitronate monooxygenase
LTKDTPVPVLVAGGIVDGRGLVAALALGCGGAVLGTRLWASKEALGHESFKELLASPENGPDQVVRTTVIDQIQNSYSATPWPVPYDSVGMLENETSKEWESRGTELEVALTSDSAIASKYRQAVTKGDSRIAQVYSGEGVGDIHSIDPAYDIIARIDKEARDIVRGMAQLLD